MNDETMNSAGAPAPNPFVALNLPAFDVRLERGRDGRVRIFDALRRRFIVVTPEEWVRQHFVNLLVQHLHYPLALMGNEIRLELNGMTRRCDTVVYDREMRPRMIVEYKRPSVELTQKVFAQVARYNLVMRVDYLVVSNGLRHFCCRMDYQQQTYAYLDAIPTPEQLLS